MDSLELKLPADCAVSCGVWPLVCSDDCGRVSWLFSSSFSSLSAALSCSFKAFFKVERWINGNCTLTRSPCGSASPSTTVPPERRTMRSTMARPRPDPVTPLRADSPRSKGAHHTRTLTFRQTRTLVGDVEFCGLVVGALFHRHSETKLPVVTAPISLRVDD